MKGDGLKSDGASEIKVASGIFGVVGAQALATQRVFAHTGHDHSRSESADESTVTDDEKGSTNDSETAAETGTDETGTGEENVAETSSVPIQEVPVVESVLATVAESSFFEDFSVGLGESVFVVIVVLPFLMMAMKKRAARGKRMSAKPKRA
ncbi:MAG: hypothetical protein AAFQ63_17725 [Cyanobacteria bacterium J06621_11]